MSRREFLAAVGGALAAWPLVRAQQSMPVLGFVDIHSPHQEKPMTLIRPVLAALAVAALVLIIDATPAEAQTATCRPWCVNYAGGARGGATNCGFILFEQCMQTAQGADFCVPNGFCPPSSGRGERRRR